MGIAIYMKENEILCNNCSSTLIEASAPKSLYAGIKQLYCEIKNIIPKKILGGLSRLKHSTLSLKTTTNYPIISNTNLPAPKNISLNLESGEWVEVLSLEEISTTLDNRRLHKGMRFMSEMEEFCGKKFRVFKKVRVIRLESTGEIRKIKTPTVLLEGVYCNGKNFEGCDRACFHYWREVWLKRIPDS
jgi:hypothetical protein